MTFIRSRRSDVDPLGDFLLRRIPADQLRLLVHLDLVAVLAPDVKERSQQTFRICGHLRLSVDTPYIRYHFCPGLVVMGGDSCSEGRGFESQH